MKTRIDNQTEIDDNEQLTITHLCNNQTVPDCSYMGNRNMGAQQVKYVGNTDVFGFGFNFMSPKWTRTKLIFDVPKRPNEAYHLYRGAPDSSEHILKFLFETAMFSLSMAMRTLFSTF